MGPAQGRLSSEPERPRVAYVVSRFPKLTETFVLYELLELERQGFAVELFPLLRERESVVQPEAEPLVARAHYLPFLSPAILAANLRTFLRAPLTYLGTLAQVLVRTAPSPNYLAGALVFFPRCVRIAELARQLGVEHVHAHFANHPALAALIVKRLAGIPFSFTAHGSDLHVDQTALAWKLGESEFAVTVSQYNVGFVRERAGAAAAEKLVVIHCGVDAELHTRAAERPSERFEILCVASLRAVKGHRYLIEACRLLKQEGLRFRCRLVGAGELERELREAIDAAGLTEEVLLVGPLARGPLLECMRAAQALVLPSVIDRQGRREGIPVTLMEAMSCGLPVVASDLSGIPELVENERSGLLVPPGDAAAIAAALRRLAGSPELRARLGQAARARVVADFDLARGARELAAEIRAHAGPRRPRS